MSPGGRQESLAFSSSSDSCEPARSPGFLPFWVASSLLVLVFCRPIYSLTVFALHSDLYSHILLIPFISAFLVWNRRSELPIPARGPIKFALIPAAAGLAVLLFYGTAVWTGRDFSESTDLSLTIFPLFAFSVATAIAFLGLPFVRSIAFPLAFLIFTVPFPETVTDLLETASQHASAQTYAWMMDASQAIYMRSGLVFSLPNLTIRIAQECSGIHSSFVLFITSLLAAHLFLRTFWKKVLFAVMVFPLGVFRNAFRIYVLSMLSSHWDPNVINSPLHHRGGPVFFLLSLIPFFLFLIWLQRSERPKNPESRQARQLAPLLTQS